MQAIQTKYICATNFRGSRIKATCSRGSITVVMPQELSGDAVHVFAVKELLAKFCAEDLKQYGTPIAKNPWNRPFVSGGLKDGTEVHVFVEREQSAQQKTDAAIEAMQFQPSEKMPNALLDVALGMQDMIDRCGLVVPAEFQAALLKAITEAEVAS